MHTRQLQESMYEVPGNSGAQRITLAVAVGLWTILMWWLLVGGGLDVAHHWFRWIPQSRGSDRQIYLVLAFSIYYVRLLFTEFVFLKRGVSWNEVLSIAPWVLFIFLLVGISGASNPHPLNVAGDAGLALFCIGSWMNSYSEYARHAWKAHIENRGKLYTKGLFRYSRHPNYLGDLVSFSGLCLISGGWVTVAIPVLMLAGFVFVNIPVLESHLRDHYGAAFDAYAKRTRKFVPFVY